MPLACGLNKREYEKFKEDQDGDTAVNICGDQLGDILDALNGSGGGFEDKDFNFVGDFTGGTASGSIIAQNLLDDSFNNVNDPVNFKAQPFVVTSSDSITSIRLKIDRSGPAFTGNLFLTINDVVANKPGATVFVACMIKAYSRG